MQTVVLSPHLDDAVLSCGGLIHELAHSASDGKGAIVINIFAGHPEREMLENPIARRIHDALGIGQELVELRRREDDLASAWLGFGNEHWSYLDAPYRRNSDGTARYASWDDIVAHTAEEDAQIVNDVCLRLRAAYGSRHFGRFLAPLAIGGHIDHRLARDVGIELFRAGYAVQFYEDVPYVAFSGPPAELVESRAWESVVCTFGARALDAKVRAVMFYRTQILDLCAGLTRRWPPPETSFAEIQQRIASGLVRCGQRASGSRELAEKLWTPPDEMRHAPLAGSQ